jgi:molybdate transport system substrate-binding protein
MVKTHPSSIVVFALLVLLIPLSARADSLKLYAAGSLQQALGDVAAAYEKTYKTKVATRFGPSGLLRKAIQEGENADVFASADMSNPEQLASSGWGGPVVLFVRNQLCALAQPGLDVTADNILETLLNSNVRVGTSTPKADPSGDYAWELFKKADDVKKESFNTLSAKALQLTGGPQSAKAPKGHNQYAWIMAEKKTDIFLTYCTNAVLARKEVPALKTITIPEQLSVAADYGLIVSNGAPNEAWRLALYILSPEGQKILKEYGFQATSIPK